jgi:hypothetical protein
MKDARPRRRRLDPGRPRPTLVSEHFHHQGALDQFLRPLGRRTKHASPRRLLLPRLDPPSLRIMEVPLLVFGTNAISA